MYGRKTSKSLTHSRFIQLVVLPDDVPAGPERTQF